MTQVCGLFVFQKEVVAMLASIYYSLIMLKIK